MIGFLRGTILCKHGESIILDVAGIGYELSLPLSLCERLREGEKAALFVHQLTRDDGQYLYGFFTLAQRAWFRELLRINGIGAKIALLILARFSGRELCEMITQKNSAALMSISGIGKKTAERIILDLQDRVTKCPELQADAPEEENARPLPQSARREAQEALIALGYKPNEAAALLVQIPVQPSEETSEIIRQALRLTF